MFIIDVLLHVYNKRISELELVESELPRLVLSGVWQKLDSTFAHLCHEPDLHPPPHTHIHTHKNTHTHAVCSPPAIVSWRGHTPASAHTSLRPLGGPGRFHLGPPPRPLQDGSIKCVSGSAALVGGEGGIRGCVTGLQAKTLSCRWWEAYVCRLRLPAGMKSGCW